MQTAGSWCRCSRGRRRRQISLWRPLCIWWLVMIWRRHCSRSGRRSPPVWFLILRRLLLGQDWVGIRLRARSQGGVEWRAGRYGRILRVGARRRIELAVTWWHAEAGLTGERGRRSLKVLASLVGYAPITCRSLSRASAHVYPVLGRYFPLRRAGLRRRTIAPTPLAFPDNHARLCPLQPAMARSQLFVYSTPTAITFERKSAKRRTPETGYALFGREFLGREGGQDGASHVWTSSGCYGARSWDGMECDVTPRCAGMDEGRAVCNVCMLGVLGYITSSSQECPTRDVEYHARWSGSPSSSPQPPRTVVSAL